MDTQDLPADLRFQHYVNDPALRGRKAPVIAATPTHDPHGALKTRVYRNFLRILANAEDDD